MAQAGMGREGSVGHTQGAGVGTLLGGGTGRQALGSPQAPSISLGHRAPGWQPPALQRLRVPPRDHSNPGYGPPESQGGGVTCGRKCLLSSPQGPLGPQLLG